MLSIIGTIVINIFLCVKDFSIIKQMMDYENDSQKIKIVGISTTILEDINELKFLAIDVIVIQFSIDKGQAAILLSQMSEHPLLHKVKKLSLFKELDSDIVHLLLQHDIQNFLLEPCTSQQLIRAIVNESEKKEMEESRSKNSDALITEALMEMGLPVHLNGFLYIKTGAILVARNFVGMRIMMISIYNEIARLHQTTASRVEK